MIAENKIVELALKNSMSWCNFPDEWRISKSIVLIKKFDNEVPANYREINFLPTT